MGMFLLRNIGWAYNDSTYEEDGAQQIVEIFDTKEEAFKRRDFLNREYFLENFGWMNRHEVYDDYAEYFKEIADYLVEELGFNSTIYLSGNANLSMFWERPEDAVVDKLIELCKIRYFTVSDVSDNTWNAIFSARLSEVYLNEENYLGDNLYKHYVENYHGMRKMYFTDQQEAYKRFIKTEYEYCYYEFNEKDALEGELDSLTNMPHILSALINECEQLSYENNRLVFHDGLDAVSFSKLNALLNIPILIFEKEPFEEIEEYDHADIKTILEDNERYWKRHEDRNRRFGTKERFFNSKDYLNCFSFELPTYNYQKQQENSYFNIILRHLLVFFEEGEIVYDHNIYYKEKRVCFYGVVSKFEQHDDQVTIEALFGIDDRPIWDMSKRAIGTGYTLEHAFKISLRNWLSEYAGEIAEKIRNVY